MVGFLKGLGIAGARQVKAVLRKLYNCLKVSYHGFEEGISGPNKLDVTQNTMIT